MFAAGSRSRTVEQNVEQPGCERRASFEPVDPAEDRQPNVLGDLLGNGTTSDRRLGHAEQARLESTDERDEGRLVTSAQPVDQFDLVVHVARRYDVHVRLRGAEHLTEPRRVEARPRFVRAGRRVIAVGRYWVVRATCHAFHLAC